jgi:hypothetical protein
MGRLPPSATRGVASQTPCRLMAPQHPSTRGGPPGPSLAHSAAVWRSTQRPSRWPMWRKSPARRARTWAAWAPASGPALPASARCHRQRPLSSSSMRLAPVAPGAPARCRKQAPTAGGAPPPSCHKRPGTAATPTTGTPYHGPAGRARGRAPRAMALRAPTKPGAPRRPGAPQRLLAPTR